MVSTTIFWDFLNLVHIFAWERIGELDENYKSDEDWLDKNLKQELVKEFDGLWIFRYVKDES